MHRSGYGRPHLPGSFLGTVPPEQWSAIWAFARAFYVGLDCAADLAAEDLADLPNETVWESALSALQDFAPFVPAPLVTPLQLGGVSIEWHIHDIDIEVRFRANHPPFVLVDDVRNECPAFRGQDPLLNKVISALKLLAQRTSQPHVIDAAA